MWSFLRSSQKNNESYLIIPESTDVKRKEVHTNADIDKYIIHGGSLTNGSLPLPGQNNVSSCSNTKLVNSIAPVPDAARALYYSDELLRNTLGKAAFSTAHIPPLRSCGQDPLDSRTSPLPLAQRNGNLKGNTTSSSATLTSDAHQRRDRVNGESKVKHRVEG